VCRKGESDGKVESERKKRETRKEYFFTVVAEEVPQASLMAT